MKILDNAVIDDSYDVVVVGAGIGGLTAGALLARCGLSTLVVEHHYLPGGCCTALRREGFTFDVGPELLYGFEERGYNPHRFVMNEIEEEIDMIPHEYVYRMRLPAGTVTFWRDQERFLDELTALYPNEDKGIRALFAEMSEVYDAIMGGDLVMPMPPTETPRGAAALNPDADPAVLERVVELMKTDSLTMVKNHISDPQVIEFFDIVAATFSSCDLSETPGVLTATMFIDNHEGGSCYAADTPQMLSNLLEKAIEKNGGQFLYESRVDEILIDDGEAHGVRLTDGTEISARAVVSNATVWNLYGQLVRPEHIHPDRIEWAQAFEPTFSFLVAYLGLDAAVIPDDLGHVEMLVLDATGFEGEGNFNIELPSREDPARCPPGTHAMTVVSPNRREWPSPYDPEYSSEEYERLKHEETEDLLNRMERFIPDIRKGIRVMEIGTPTTVERYTLRNWGNLGGPKPSLGQHMLNRPRAHSDWVHLYLVGDSTVMGEGVLSSTSSGIGAANMVLRDLGRDEYLPRHHPRQYINFMEGKPWTPAPPLDTPLDAAVARRLAHECQLCEDAPCVQACPASIDIPGFLRRIEAGNLEGAADAIRETNPLSELCGAICPAERLCESVCTRREFADEPVPIAKLHGWVCEQSPARTEATGAVRATGSRVAVVGAGPAGLTCAHYLARCGHQVDLLDRADRPGGLLAQAVPTFRLDDAAVRRETEGLLSPCLDFKPATTLGRDVTLTSLEEGYDAVFLAAGLATGRTLDLPGIEQARNTDALSFLRDYRRDGTVDVAPRVLIVGGGSVAADAAMTASVCGASEITVACLENEADMPALATEVTSMNEAGIEIRNGWGPLEVRAGTRLVLAECTSVFDTAGAFSPTLDMENQLELDFDLLVFAVGQEVDGELGTHLETELGSAGLVDVDDSLRVVGRQQVFAGGDIVRGTGTAVDAVRDGRRAAAEIHSALI